MASEDEYYRALRKMYQAQADRAVVEELIDVTKRDNLDDIETVDDLLNLIGTEE